MNNEQNFRKFCPIRPVSPHTPWLGASALSGRAASGVSLPKQEDDDFERHIEENDFGIGILRNHALAVFEEVGDVNDVCLVDEAGKVLGKVLLILRHVAQFRIPEVVHETFSEHVHEVVEHAFLLFSSEVAITSVHFLRSPILRM